MKQISILYLSHHIHFLFENNGPNKIFTGDDSSLLSISEAAFPLYCFFLELNCYCVLFCRDSRHSNAVSLKIGCDVAYGESGY